MNAFGGGGGGGNSSSSIPTHKPKAPLPRPQSQQNQSDQVSILVRPQKVIMTFSKTRKEKSNSSDERFFYTNVWENDRFSSSFLTSCRKIHMEYD